MRTRQRTDVLARAVRPVSLVERLEPRRLLAFNWPPTGEFLVNTYTTDSQEAPAVACDADGDFVVTWHSRLGGDGDWGIHAQRYDAAGGPQGAEFLVNTHTYNSQAYPAVAMDADGDFVIVWGSQHQDGSEYGIYAQRYDAAGVAQGGEFRVNTYTTDHQRFPSVAMDADGDFVITWQSRYQDGSGYGTYAQRYNASGVPQGGEFRVNTYTANHQNQPRVAMDAAGDFVVIWASEVQDGNSWGTYGQRFNAAGVAQGSEFRVNTYTTSVQRVGSVAMDADGDFVVAWASYAQDGNNYGIYAQRYNAGGVAQGSEFKVNTYTTNNQWVPAVAMDADGDFVVAWESNGQDGSLWGVYAQRYNSAGVAQGSEFRVNTYTTNQQRYPSVAMDADGDFIVAWETYGQAHSYDIYARRYNASGMAQGAEFRTNSYTNGGQNRPRVAMDAGGNFVVAWHSFHQDAINNSGIYAQRYNASGLVQGSEFRVNTFTSSDQKFPAVAMDADGDFVVAWQSNGQDNSSYGVYGQRFDAAGVPQGGEFRPNTYTSDSQRSPAVAMDADGDFVVAWQSNGQDGSSYGVYGQRYNAAGVAQGGEFRVNTSTTSQQTLPAIAMDADGDFLVAWDSWQVAASNDVYMQRYTAFNDGSAATVGNLVWADLDGDGIQDAGENGYQGATVQAFTPAGLPATAPVTTPASGLYSLPVLPDASFYLQFTVPSFYVFTRKDQGVNDALDSDVDRATGRSPVLSVPLASPNLTIDAGVATTSTAASGTLYYDRNGNGSKDAGEEPLPGMKVFGDLDSDGLQDADEPTADTTATGTFTLTSLLPGPCGLRSTDQPLWVEYATSINPTWGQNLSSQLVRVRTAVQDTTAPARGGETRVNNTATDIQAHPSIAADADGDYVVVWASRNQDGYGYGIYAQRYNASGVAQGGEFRVNTFTNSDQSYPAVAMDADGDFVVTWYSYAQDQSGFGVYAQRFDAAGTAQGGEFRVNTYTTGHQCYSAVAMDADGDFVIAWGDSSRDNGWGVYAQRYNAVGTPVGGEFRVNSYTTGNQRDPGVAMGVDGEFVLTWQSNGQDGGGYGIYAQRYSAAGVAQGTEFRVNTYTANSQSYPAVAMSRDGDFVITWQSSGQDDSNYGVYAQRYDAAGAAQGSEFRVNATTTGDQRYPKPAIDADGDLVITWGSLGQDGDGWGTYAQRYNAAGVVQGSELRVNTYTRSIQAEGRAAIDADGDLVIVWRSDEQDGSGGGIYSQRYGSPVASRGVIYNNSDFDGNGATIDASDAAAVAVDKRPLAPGHKAGFANYTSYSRGINAIYVDLRDNTAAPTASDFIVRVGNSGNYYHWSAAPTPTITYLAGGGVGGSNRVVLSWSDNAIQKQWLAVTVKANATTGLTIEDTLMFGNAIGESGNSTADARVTSADEILARNNPRTQLDPAPIDFRFDYNRDKVVNSADQMLARNNLTSFVTELKLIDTLEAFPDARPAPLGGGLSVRTPPSLWSARAITLLDPQLDDRGSGSVGVLLD